MAGGQEQKDIKNLWQVLETINRTPGQTLKRNGYWEKEKSVILLLSLSFQKHLWIFQCTIRQSWFFMADRKRSSFLRYSKKDITNLAEVNFWPTNTSYAAMFLRPSKLSFRLKQFGFQLVNATQIHLDNSTSLDQIKNLINISKVCHQFIWQNSRTKQKSPEKW